MVMAKHASVDNLYTVSKSEILGGWVKLCLNSHPSVKSGSLPEAEPKMKKCLLVLTWELKTLRTNISRGFNHFWKISPVP
jgi:hypothetical protein